MGEAKIKTIKVRVGRFSSESSIIQIETESHDCLLLAKMINSLHRDAAIIEVDGGGGAIVDYLRVSGFQGQVKEVFAHQVKANSGNVGTQS